MAKQTNQALDQSIAEGAKRLVEIHRREQAARAAELARIDAQWTRNNVGRD